MKVRSAIRSGLLEIQGIITDVKHPRPGERS